jgi:hypothetical protein
MVSHLVTKPLDSSQSAISGPCLCIHSFITLFYVSSVTWSIHVGLVLPSSLHLLSSFLVLSEESVVHYDTSLCHRILNYTNIVVLASCLFCALIWDFVPCSFINTLLDLLYACSLFISPLDHVHMSVSYVKIAKWYVYVTQKKNFLVYLWHSYKISWSCASLYNFFDISIWWNFTLSDLQHNVSSKWQWTTAVSHFPKHIILLYTQKNCTYMRFGNKPGQSSPYNCQMHLQVSHIPTDTRPDTTKKCWDLSFHLCI